MYKFVVLILTLFTLGCEKTGHLKTNTTEDHSNNFQMAGQLKQILSEQPETTQERYTYRHPKETLNFFGITPGMTVVEVLPGRGWYSKILLPYLGDTGTLIGADYDRDMFPLFGVFSDQWIQAKQTWIEDWTADALTWRSNQKTTVNAFVLGSMPDSMKQSADAVLIIRALHNLVRFRDQKDFLTAALQDFYDVLKPGGIVGVVQHEARPEMPDNWASGKNGYLKKAFVITQFENMGFEYLGESAINQNPKDQPGSSDFVWRLPPSYRTSSDDPKLKAQFDLIGESNRMTLKFRKPL